MLIVTFLFATLKETHHFSTLCSRFLPLNWSRVLDQNCSRDWFTNEKHLLQFNPPKHTRKLFKETWQLSNMITLNSTYATRAISNSFSRSTLPLQPTISIGRILRNKKTIINPFTISIIPSLILDASLNLSLLRKQSSFSHPKTHFRQIVSSYLITKLECRNLFMICFCLILFSKTEIDSSSVFLVLLPFKIFQNPHIKTQLPWISSIQKQILIKQNASLSLRRTRILSNYSSYRHNEKLFFNKSLFKLCHL